MSDEEDRYMYRMKLIRSTTSGIGSTPRLGQQAIGRAMNERRSCSFKKEIREGDMNPLLEGALSKISGGDTVAAHFKEGTKNSETKRETHGCRGQVRRGSGDEDARILSEDYRAGCVKVSQRASRGSTPGSRCGATFGGKVPLDPKRKRYRLKASRSEVPRGTMTGTAKKARGKAASQHDPVKIETMISH